MEGEGEPLCHLADGRRGATACVGGGGGWMEGVGETACVAGMCSRCVQEVGVGGTACVGGSGWRGEGKREADGSHVPSGARVMKRLQVGAREMDGGMGERETEESQVS